MAGINTITELINDIIVDNDQGLNTESKVRLALMATITPLPVNRQDLNLMGENGYYAFNAVGIFSNLPIIAETIDLTSIELNVRKIGAVWQEIKLLDTNNKVYEFSRIIGNSWTRTNAEVIDSNILQISIPIGEVRCTDNINWHSFHKYSGVNYYKTTGGSTGTYGTTADVTPSVFIPIMFRAPFRCKLKEFNFIARGTSNSNWEFNVLKYDRSLLSNMSTLMPTTTASILTFEYKKMITATIGSGLNDVIIEAGESVYMLFRQDVVSGQLFDSLIDLKIEKV